MMKMFNDYPGPGSEKTFFIPKGIFWIIISVFILFLVTCHKEKSTCEEDKTKNSLEEGFKNPPLSALPRAYWAWINGNVNLPQLTHELEEYKDKGFSGLDIFDIGAVDPNKVVPEGNQFLGEESVEAITYAVKEAKRLGLELGFIASSSWNAGGDWVTPEYAAMLLYKSEITVEGPSEFSGLLPFPQVSELTPKNADGSPVYYKKVAVIAFPCTTGDPVPDKSSVIDLTAKTDNKGNLKWTVPPGKWKIMQFICSNSGQKLVLPSPKSDGFNIDHFNPSATEMHFQYVINKLQKELGDFSNTALKFMYLCSYELKGLVWTPEMLEEFNRRRGYDMIPFLPVLYGEVIQNKDITDRFIFDFNMTLSDLIIEGHYGKARELLNKYGLKLCSEAGGPGQPLHNCPFEALRALGVLDIPRGEFWNKHQVFDEKGRDIMWLVKEIACAAHIYGKTIVDGEAFTSWLHWQEGPFDLKPLADKAMCEGLNLFTFHTGTHNPPEGGKPGWVYHAGTHMNPNRIWWPKIKPFINYLARSSYLLQQGKFVGDVCYYYGDHAPNFVKPKHIDPSLGYGFDYDVTNSEVILTRMNTRNGKIILPDGMSYELLVLPDQDDANPEVLEKLTELVKKGATIVGPKPTRSNGLTDYPHRDEKVKALADELWGSCNGKESKENSYGKGKVIWGKDLKEILAERNIIPDFMYSGKNDSTDLDYIHRSTAREEIYFISNKKLQWAEAECTFRVKNKTPELWMPETGEITKEPFYVTNNNTTKVFLQLPPAGSVFVVFREKSDHKNIVSISKDNESVFPITSGSSNAISPVDLLDDKTNEIDIIIKQNGTYTFKNAKDKLLNFEIKNILSPLEISGSWNVNFPAGWGAPATAVFPQLISWTTHKDAGIKYFSGIATYQKEFDVPDDFMGTDNLFYLDLGIVKMIADVYLNDEHLGILWQPPFRLDITNSIKPGRNKLVIEVANDWSNRIVGDQKLPEKKRFTSTNITSPFSSDVLWKEAPLLESGLIGPVQIVPAKKVMVKF
jgi:hypothetical protein